MKPLTLYHYWRSSCSWRVRWCLHLKNIPYISKPINILTGEHKSPSYLAINPSGYLPSIEIDGQHFGESLAIIDWLEEVYPSPSIYPKDRILKLRAKQIALTIASGIQPLQNPALLAYFEPDEAKRREHAHHFIERGLEVVEKLISPHFTGLFSIGETVTVADLCLIPQVYNAKRFNVDLNKFPCVKKIYESVLATPACQLAAPEAQSDAVTQLKTH